MPHDDMRVVRFESLFALIERLTQSPTIQECAEAAAPHLKHVGNVSTWRILLQREHGFLCIDGVRGKVTVTELLELPAWDQRLWNEDRPQVLSGADLHEGLDEAPEHLTGPTVGELFALPVRHEGQPDALFIATTRQDHFTTLDHKFLKMSATLICDHMGAVVMRSQIIKSLQEQAWRDGLTGLANRRALIDFLHKAMANTQRTSVPISVVICDLDRFKLINDTYGHAAGDDVLREVSRRMTALTREGDLAGRFGGEEFLLVLHACPPDGAAVVAERVRQGIAATPITLASLDDAPEITVTLSLGAASTQDHPSNTAAELIRSADEALYRAKQNGRNQVCVDRMSNTPVEDQPHLWDVAAERQTLI